MKTRLVVLLCFLCFYAQNWAQNPTDKYWVMFTDKGDVSRWSPHDFLSQRSIDRRARQGLAIQWSDYPIHAPYMQGVAGAGAALLQPSKWLNAISVRMDDVVAARVAALPYVREVKRIPKVIKEMDAAEPVNARFGYDDGYTHHQISMIGLDKMHQNGYNGKGILISVMDNGFKNADKNPNLAHLFETNRIVASHDFVHGEANVFDEGDHGQWVLTILAGWVEKSDDTRFWFYGSAHGASFILCHTEDNSQEVSQEEDNWARAMEYADSIGADVFSTSLGYRGFDGGGGYSYGDMDGNTTIITRAADLAASKGIVVVNAAGNDGPAKMLAPSDGDSVISVGAVDSAKVIAGFSAQGPSIDGRVKPDISTMGAGTSFISNTGMLSRGNGTSFACPVASGMAACLLQSAPTTPNMVLYDAIIRSADRYETPDSFYGYGIPYAPDVYKRLTGKDLPGVLPASQLGDSGIAVFPNPAMDHFNLVIDNDILNWTGSLEMVDMGGRIVWTRKLEVASFYNVFHYTRADHFAHLPSGRYALRVRDAKGEVKFAGKFTLLTQR